MGYGGSEHVAYGGSNSKARMKHRGQLVGKPETGTRSTASRGRPSAKNQVDRYCTKELDNYPSVP